MSRPHRELTAFVHECFSPSFHSIKWCVNAFVATRIVNLDVWLLRAAGSALLRHLWGKRRNGVHTVVAADKHILVHKSWEGCRRWIWSCGSNVYSGHHRSQPVVLKSPADNQISEMGVILSLEKLTKTQSPLVYLQYSWALLRYCVSYNN